MECKKSACSKLLYPTPAVSHKQKLLCYWNQASSDMRLSTQRHSWPPNISCQKTSSTTAGNLLLYHTSVWFTVVLLSLPPFYEGRFLLLGRLVQCTSLELPHRESHLHWLSKLSLGALEETKLLWESSKPSLYWDDQSWILFAERAFNTWNWVPPQSPDVSFSDSFMSSLGKSPLEILSLRLRSDFFQLSGLFQAGSTDCHPPEETRLLKKSLAHPDWLNPARVLG